MTDEMQIQQQRPSALPYALGGGVVVGGASALAGTKWDKVKGWISDPAKYKSYEDIINEADDTFTKNVENASSDDKGVWEKATEARKAGKTAGEKYDADLKAFKENYKPGELAELADDHEAVKAFNAKRQELIDAEIQKIKDTPTGKDSISQNKILKAKANRLYSATTNEQKEKIMTEIDEICEKLADKYIYEGDEEAVKKAKEAVKKELKAHTLEMTALKDANKALPTQPKVVTDYVAKQAKIANLEKGITDAVETIGKTTGLDLKGFAIQEEIDSMLNRKVYDFVNNEKKMVKTLENLKKTYLKASSKKDLSFKERLIAAIDTLVHGKVIDVKSEDTLTRMLKDLDKKQQTELQKLLKDGELSEKLFDDAIKVREDKIGSIKKSFDTILENQENLYGKRGRKGLKSELKSDLEAIKRAYKDKGADYVNKDGILCKKDGTPIEYKPTGKKSASGIKLPKGVKEPEGGVKLERLNSELSLDEITTRASNKIDSNAKELLKTEQEAIDSARKALGKNPERTAEELVEEFVKKNGTKDDAIKKATKGYQDDLAKLFGKKVNNKKLAALIAGGTLVGAAVGLALRPKAKEV